LDSLNCSVHTVYYILLSIVSISAAVIATLRDMLHWTNELERNSFKLSSLRISLSLSNLSIISCALWSFCVYISWSSTDISSCSRSFSWKFCSASSSISYSISWVFCCSSFLYISWQSSTSIQVDFVRISSRSLFAAVELVCDTFRRSDSKTTFTIASAPCFTSLQVCHLISKMLFRILSIRFYYSTIIKSEFY